MRYKPCTPCADHHGKVFPCFKDMCEYWGRIPQTVRDRESRGWSRQKALTTQGCDPRREELWQRYKDYIPYGLSMATIWYRLGKGWSEELAFTAPPYSKLKELLKQQNEPEQPAKGDNKNDIR